MIILYTNEALLDFDNLVDHSLQFNKKSEYRRLVCGKYLVFYVVHARYIEIARIFDGRQEWQRTLFSGL